MFLLSGTGIENEDIVGNPENFVFFKLFGGSWGELRAPGGRKSPKIRGISRIRREFPSLYPGVTRGPGVHLSSVTAAISGPVCCYASLICDM